MLYEQILRKEIMKIKITSLFTLMFLLLMVGCNPAQTTPEPTSTDPDAYPVVGEDGYPLSEILSENDDAYPIEEVDPGYKQGPEFHIDLLVSGGDQTVTGKGPAGVPIILVDVSEVGLTLGETTIADNGTFDFILEEPLQSGHTIGLQIGNIEGTEWEESDFLYSETYYERPLVGILFDMVVVE
jgi:hypothetical protein